MMPIDQSEMGGRLLLVPFSTSSSDKRKSGMLPRFTKRDEDAENHKARRFHNFGDSSLIYSFLETFKYT
jgi:hypothetical protein